VNASAAASLTVAFRQLFTARFPIRQMRAADDFGGDDERSVLADNTSAFNCRLVPAPPCGRSTPTAWLCRLESGFVGSSFGSPESP
jgi:hypothetical protein